MNPQTKIAHPLAANASIAAASISGPVGIFVRARLVEHSSAGNSACGHTYYVDTPAYDHTRSPR